MVDLRERLRRYIKHRNTCPAYRAEARRLLQALRDGRDRTDRILNEQAKQEFDRVFAMGRAMSEVFGKGPRGF